MKALIVANNKPGRFSPFITKQVDALKELGVEFDFFGVDGGVVVILPTYHY